MGHAIEYITVESRKDIIPTAEEFAYYNVDPYENTSRSYHGNMHIHDNIICESYEDAKEKIDALDKGWYDDHAVRYKDKDSLPPTKSMQTLKGRMNKNRADKKEYAEQHSVGNRKSAFVGCPKCESKLATKYLRSERCPLCSTELRAEYIINRLNKYDEDYKEMELKYQKMVKERKGKCKTKWLFKVEVHC